ncbi:MAG: siphovirus Gp157 family protein [bacterium]|nr:siphovirus Gp157 family protein [bacterium]
MSSLYEITGNINMLINMIDEGDSEFSDDCLIDTWESLDEAFDVKAEGWCKSIKNYEKMAENVKAEVERMRARQKMLELRVTRMKSILAELMVKAEKKKVETDTFTVNRVKLNGKLDVDGISAIPSDYIIEKKVETTKKEPDKEKIRAELESGNKLPFARFYNSCSIS